jgi:hypothetical protein
MAITGHAMLIDLQCKSLKTVARPVATASFTTDSIIIINIQKQELISIEGIHIKSPMPRKYN